MAVTLILSVISLLILYAQAQNDFTVTSPEAGDTVTLSSSTINGARIPIVWTVADALADRPVFISLVQGNNLSSLTLIEQVNSEATNNGSYTWQGASFDSALIYGYSHGTPSGCNYSIELKVWTDVVYSPYFTIINPEDGGLDVASQCPSGDSASVGPSSRTYASNGGGGQDQTSSTSNSAGSASSAATAGSTGISGGGGSTSDSDDNGSGGVSTTTLAIAVAIPVVVLLIVFGLILWFGMRRGWFVKKGKLGGAARNIRDGEKSDAVIESGAGKAMGDTGEPAYLSVRELHANDMPHQLGSKPIHELQGGSEDGRLYGGRS